MRASNIHPEFWKPDCVFTLCLYVNEAIYFQMWIACDGKRLLLGFSLDTAHIRIRLLTSFHQKHGASSFWGYSFLALQWRDFFSLSRIHREGIPHVVKISPAHWRCFLSRQSFGLLRKTRIFLLEVRVEEKGKICAYLDSHPNSSFSIATALVRGFRVWAFLLFPPRAGLSQGPTLDRGPNNGFNNAVDSPVSAGQIPSLSFTWQLLLGTPMSEQSHTMQKDTENRRLTPSLLNLLVERVHRWS